MHLAGDARDETARVARERMSENVAGIHQGHQRFDDLVGRNGDTVGLGPELAEMDIEWQPGFSRNALADLDDLQPPA